jgi:hypothetical protein
LPLTSTGDMLWHAKRKGYAVPGFEPYTLEQIQAILETAEEERAPVLIQLWAEVIATWGIETLAGIVRDMASRLTVPVGLHLDHAMDDALIDAALNAGFTSVMFDGSMLPMEENLARTRDVVRRAHALGVVVEAELGVIGHLTPADDPEETLRRIAEMLTDALPRCSPTRRQREILFWKRGWTFLRPPSERFTAVNCRWPGWIFRVLRRLRRRRVCRLRCMVGAGWGMKRYGRRSARVSPKSI